MNTQPIQHLIDEPPLMVLPTLAKHLGINQAIILQQVHFLVQMGIKTDKEKKKFVDGQWWCYNTYDEWLEDYFSWMSSASLRRYVKELEDAGLLISRSSVKHKSDRTKWYRVDYDVYQKMVESWSEKDAPKGDSEGEEDPSAQNEHMGASDQNEQMVDLLKMSTSNWSNRADGYTETSSETSSEIDSTSRGHASAQSAIEVPTPSDDLRRPPGRFVPQETNGEEEVKSELQLYIEQSLCVQLTKKHVALLENEPYTINEETREKKKEPSAIQRYQDDERYRKYVVEQMDYYVNLCDEKNLNRKDVRQRACNSISNMHLDRYGFFKWLARQGEPIDRDDDGPVAFVIIDD